MQTFLPFADYRRSARVLDRLRLGKQRGEAKQIMQALLGARSSWARHPAVLMWAGYEYQLRSYTLAVCEEWVARGYADSVAAWMLRLRLPTCGKPWWFGRPLFHLCHRSNLMRKNPEWYSQFWDVRADLDYWWPTKENAQRTQKAVEQTETALAARGRRVRLDS